MPSLKDSLNAAAAPSLRRLIDPRAASKLPVQKLRCGHAAGPQLGRGGQPLSIQPRIPAHAQVEHLRGARALPGDYTVHAGQVRAARSCRKRLAREDDDCVRVWADPPAS